MPATRMSHQIDRTGAECLDERNHVGNMLRHVVVVAETVPMLGKTTSQADRDDAMALRQWPKHAGPDAEIAQAPVHADQRLPLPHIEVRHVVAVDPYRLHVSPVPSRSMPSETAPPLRWHAQHATPD